MKKYVKPELFYERYEVSQHIADCAWEWRNNTDASNCFAAPDSQGKLPGMVPIFVSKDNGCSFLDAEEYENYCYQPGAGGIKLAVS